MTDINVRPVAHWSPDGPAGEAPTEPLPIWVSRSLEHHLLPGFVGDTISRLVFEFGDRIDTDTVASIVIGAYRDLQGNAHQALPELVERSARQRILDRSATARPSAGTRMVG